VSVKKKTNPQQQELQLRTNRYREIDADIEALVMALQAHQKSILQVQKTRMVVAECLAKLSKRTPLHHILGSMESSAASNRGSSKSSSSYYTAHFMVAENIKAKLETFHPSIQGYAMEWQKTVQRRIQKDSQITKRRRFEHEHYRRKTTQLHRKVRHAASRGTPVPARIQEKLVRNERKLQTSTEAYQQAHANMRMILDEATQQYWRDMYPLIWHCTVLDSKLVRVEMQTLERYLPTVRETLTAMAHEYRIPTDENRLAEWAHSNPAILCTNAPSSEEPFIEQPMSTNRFIPPSHHIHRIEEEEEEEGFTTAVGVSTPFEDHDGEENSKLKDPNDPNYLRDNEILVAPMPTSCLQKIPRTASTTSHGRTTNSHQSNIRNNTKDCELQNHHLPQPQKQQSYMPRFKDQAQTVICNGDEATPIVGLPVATPVPMEHEENSRTNTQR
jgi:hypothetical protein